MIAGANKNDKTPCGINSAEDSAGKMPASQRGQDACVTFNKRGSVLIVGGGIAGMQAALDCANSGLKVYLVEEQPAIGGNMAALDKTFPTNDCAMCMLSPKLVEVGRHLNIDIISYADVKKIEGQAGNFTVTVNKRARFVDENLCNGCGECAEACPVLIKDTFNGELAERKAIYRLYPQAIPNIFTIDKRELPPPCRATCPAGVNAQGYVALIAKGKFLEALDVVRERMPFAGTCGRICHHPCEQNCNRAQIDAAVSVRNLKRFVADYERDKLLKGESIERPPSERVKPEKQDYTEKVAIIGGGPAGLTCAYDLALKGYKPTLFEASKELGGMMRSGIPAYRLPREYLDFEIKLLLNEGVEVRTGKALGRDMQLADLKTQGYASVFIAMGAPLARKIPLAGSDSRGVLYGMDFLREVNAGSKPSLGKNVIVIGGGNVAMDVARSALRVSPGSTVSLFCLESGPEMPAHEWEIKEAVDEGVKMNPSWGPSNVVSENGKAVALELARCTRVFDDQRKFAPQFDAAQKQTVKADTIILAVGQACDLGSIENALVCERGVIKSHPLTLQTSREGIFAGGDIVLGPASLVEAVAQGHRAAESIHRYLRGEDIAADREPVERPTEFAGMPQQGVWSNAHRYDVPQESADTRTKGFVEIDSGYTEAMAIAEASRCLNCGGCSVCRECVRVCKAHAINHDMQDKQVSLNVGAVIYAGGYDVFDATRKSEYGFGRFPNVVTSMQFERILSASGPYEGHLKRPGDGKTARRVAWIQCVGSRDVTCGNDYCSSVCCMYATKEAIIAKEHQADVEPTIFFIDLRAFGKGFESFYNRAENDYGVRYVRSQISSVKENPVNGNLIVRYVGENGQGLQEEEFDMVVLSVGLTAHHSTRQLAQVAGLTTNRFGFIENQPYLQSATNRDGIFMCGAVSGPRDIPETVMQASAAAALAGELLGVSRGSEVEIKEYPPQRDITGEDPRIGVFICHCGSNIASTINVEQVAEAIGKIPGVVHAETNIYTCSQDTQEKMKQIIRDQRLNRVIVASCTPRTHQPLFQETMREAGLNQWMFEMADIREQCSWVHQKDPTRATQKAIDLVRGSVGKSKFLEPLTFQKVGVTRAALVIGGGVSGMAAALSLARQGFATHLVEKSDKLGGNLYHVHHSIEGHDWQAYLHNMIRDVQAHENITVYLNSQIDEVAGFVGNFTTRLQSGSTAEIKHGIIIVATGAAEYQPDKFLFDQNNRVITQWQLEEKLQNGFNAENVVMIQCVGSRDTEHPWCSRVCCGEAVKNALAIKAKNPAATVTILYRDIRTYEYKEIYYRQARERGVRFIHFPDDKYPDVAAKGNGLKITVHDTVINEAVTLTADMLVLSAATVPDLVTNERLSELLKVPLNSDGYFMEAHVKLRPVDFANEGIYVCGLAHSPKYTEENITQALAAAGRAAVTLSKEFLEVGGVIAVINEDLCASCLTCVRECVYNAPFINERGKAEIEAAKCQGCGNCTAACPAKAIQLRTFTDDQEHALFMSILKHEDAVEVCP